MKAERQLRRIDGSNGAAAQGASCPGESHPGLDAGQSAARLALDDDTGTESEPAHIWALSVTATSQSSGRWVSAARRRA